MKKGTALYYDVYNRKFKVCPLYIWMVCICFAISSYDSSFKMIWHGRTSNFFKVKLSCVEKKVYLDRCRQYMYEGSFEFSQGDVSSLKD